MNEQEKKICPVCLMFFESHATGGTCTTSSYWTRGISDEEAKELRQANKKKKERHG